MKEILVIVIEGWKVEVRVSLVFVIILVALPLIWNLMRSKRLVRQEIIEIEVALGGLGKMKIKPGYDEMRIAHKAWVELSTRKAGLLFDEDHDVIVEVYNSWYELFKQMRELLKEIPIERIRTNNDTSKLVKILIGALNKGLRPHLTQWQAKFRKWYEWRLEQEKENKHSTLTPQELQREYPDYERLTSELKAINIQLIQYVEQLEKIAHGPQSDGQV